jgi:LysM repeat protein
MNCYACDQEAVRRCSRCDNPYCPEHGSTAEEAGPPLCAECLDPVRATPSSTIFRASVFALFVASVIALWLLIRPPGLPQDSSSALEPIVTNAPTATPRPSTTAPATSGTPAASATPAASGASTPTPSGATPTPAATPAATVAPTAAPAPIQYTVVDGDTWFGLAAQFGVDAEALAAANGRTLDDFLHIGETITIPR